MAERADVAIVGTGLVGAAAMRHLSAAHARVIGIGTPEPADWAAHTGPFASHYDSGRITRRLDRQLEWAILAARAIDHYALIEAASATQFHSPVGLILAEVDPARRAATEAVAAQLRVGAERRADSGDARVTVPAGATVWREPPPAGWIDPRKMLAAQLRLAASGGAVHVSATAFGIERRRNGWRVHTTAGDIDARNVVIAGGPHVDELRGLPITPWIDVIAETVVLAEVDETEQHRLHGLPSIIIDDPAHDHLYIVPPAPYPDGKVYVKLGATRSDQRTLDAGERRAWMRGTEHRGDLPHLRALMTAVLPGIRAVSWHTKPCLIPQTPTARPYVAAVDDGLVYAVGTNGYAAKSADAIGALAARLALHGAWTDPELNAERFAVIGR